jgi:hypothetical protein
MICLSHGVIVCGGGSLAASGAAFSISPPAKRCAGDSNVRGIAAAGGGPSRGIGTRRRFHCQRRMRSRSVPDEMPYSAQMSSINRSVCS